MFPSHSPSIMAAFSSSVVLSSFRMTSSAVRIHSKYPFSSLSICCCRRNFKNSLRFSTRSLSLANSLKTEFVRNAVFGRSIPRKNTKNQIEHEERAQNDEGHEVGPVEGVAQGIICLKSISSNSITKIRDLLHST